MGTQGYVVYRCKSRYHVRYNNQYSDPSWLGLQVLEEIPSGASFKQWVEVRREKLVKEYDRWVQNGRPDGDVYFITDTQPCTDVSIEWIYEIDLDRLVFHIDSCPVFRLDNMPPPDVFLRCISFDHYGGRAYARDTPEEFRYNLKTPPPSVDESMIEAYNRHAGIGAILPIHDLLEIVEHLSNLESVWERYLQVCVGQLLRGYGAQLRDVESRAGPAELTEMDTALALSAINMAFPALLDHGSPPFPLPARTDDLWWVREDVCVCATTHIDDEPFLQFSIAALREAIIKKTDSPDIVYGIITSSFHVAIVRVDKVSGGSLKHTPALELLPSFYAMSPSTPGIIALVRLARHTRAFTRSQLPLLPSTSAFSRLPHQILGEFAKHITSAHDLENLAMAAESTFSAAEPYLEFPRVGDQFLISPQTPGPSDCGVHRNYEAGPVAHPSLTSGAFEVLKETGAEVVTIGGNRWYEPPGSIPLNTFSPVKVSFPPLAK